MSGRTHWGECWRDPAHHGCAVGEIERLKARDEEWQRKASAWMASPEATQWLDGYRELAQKLNAAEAEAQKWKTEYSRIAGDYAEEASYLRKRAERAEDIAKSVRTGAPLYDMLEQRNAAITRAEQAEAEVERLRAALQKIAYLQHDIGRPPLISEAEAMRIKARDALEGK